jgi:hypothetical protein
MSLFSRRFPAALPLLCGLALLAPAAALASPPGFGPGRRAVLRATGASFARTGGAGGILALASAQDPRAAAFGAPFLALGAGGAGLADALRRVTRVGPDDGFADVAKPSFVFIGQFDADGPLTHRLAKAVKALTASETDATAYLAALAVADDRAAGAIAAGDTRAETRQRNAAARYSVKAAGVLRQQVPLRRRVVAALRASRAPRAVSAPRSAGLAAHVRRDGLPGFTRRLLRHFGVLPSSRRALQREVGRRHGRTSVIAALTARRVARGERRAVKVLDPLGP